MPLSAVPTHMVIQLHMRMTPAVDVFNAGCLIYHILSDGYFPYGERYAHQTLCDRVTDGYAIGKREG